jgi:repressor LexA
MQARGLFMNILYKNIKALRKQHNLSQEELAQRTGYTDRSSIAKIEAGEVDLPQSKIQLFADVFHVTPQYLMGYTDDKVSIRLPSPESVRTIPVYADLSCGTGLFVEDQIVDTVTVPVSMLPNKNAEYFAQFASGDSMTDAGINHGDLVIFKKTSTIDNGQIGCFCIDENVATCKKFSQIGGSVYLMPANDKYQPIPIEPENQCFRVIGLLVAQVSKR